MLILYTILFFLLGVILTSFFGLIAQRIPKQESIKGRSYCNTCKHTLTWMDIIPSLGYLINKGKCRFCKERIPLNHLLTVALGGVLFAGSFYFIGFDLELIVVLIMISVLLIESISDYYYRIVIDRIWIGGIVVLIGVRIIQEQFLLHLISSLVLFTIMFILASVGKKVLGKETLGGGDVKLYLFIGFCITYGSGLLSLFVASLLGFAYGVFKKEKEIPLVPFIAIGVLISFVFGETVIDWYLRFLGIEN